MVTLPEDGWISPPIHKSNVVLPEPEGPTIATNSPSSMNEETWLSARTVFPLLLYVFERFSIRIIYISCKIRAGSNLAALLAGRKEAITLIPTAITTAQTNSTGMGKTFTPAI